MKRKILRSIVFGMVVSSVLSVWNYDQVVLAQSLRIPISKTNIAMSYTDPLTGQKMPDESEKEAMKIAKTVTQDFFKALYDKQYRVAYNYFSSEIQSKVGYETFAKGFSNNIYVSLQYCGPIAFEGNLVIIGGRYEQLKRTVDGKIDPRLYEFKLAVNKIGNDWKIVDFVEEDVTLKYL